MVITSEMVKPVLAGAAVLVSVVLWLASVHHTAQEAHHGVSALRKWEVEARAQLSQQDRDLEHLAGLLDRIDRKLDKQPR